MQNACSWPFLIIVGQPQWTAKYQTLTQFPPATSSGMGKEGRKIKSKKIWDQQQKKRIV